MPQLVRKITRNQRIVALTWCSRERDSAPTLPSPAVQGRESEERYTFACLASRALPLCESDSSVYLQFRLLARVRTADRQTHFFPHGLLTQSRYAPLPLYAYTRQR
jgi:hypothetical protein